MKDSKQQGGGGSKNAAEEMESGSRGDEVCYLVIKTETGDTVKVAIPNDQFDMTQAWVAEKLRENQLTRSQIKSIIIPEGVISLGAYAFRSFMFLGMIFIPVGMKEVSRDAFDICSSIKLMFVPMSMADDRRRWGYHNRDSIQVQCYDPAIIKAPLSERCDYIKDVYVRLYKALQSKISNSYHLYKELSQAQAFLLSVFSNNAEELEKIKQSSFLPALTGQGSGDGLDSKKEESADASQAVTLLGELGIKTVDGAIINIPIRTDESCISRIWLDSKLEENEIDPEKIQSIKIPDGVTGIGDSAFEDFIALQVVDMPSSVRSLGMHAFLLCDSLESLIIPDGVETIRPFAFYCCYKLQFVVISNSVKHIGERAFAECSKLCHIIMSAGLVSVGDYAFHSCRALPFVIFPARLQHMNRCAYYSSGAKFVLIPSTLNITAEHLSTYDCPQIETYNPTIADSLPMDRTNALRELYNRLLKKYPNQFGGKGSGEAMFDSLRTIIPAGEEVPSAQPSVSTAEVAATASP